jgi:prolyl oligopeptidase
VFGNTGPVLYVRTDDGAPNRRSFVDVSRSDLVGNHHFRAQGGDRDVALIGGRIVVHYSWMRSRGAVQSAGGPQGSAPGLGAIVGVSGREDSPEIFYAFTSPLYRTTVFVHDPRTGKNTPFEAVNSPVDMNRYETKQLFATSKDGTRIPFFLTARKNLSRNGANPTMLYGYGGYSISIMPVYRPHVLAWLELGGIWVSANLRGGGEYGEAWHKGGMVENKQNVFDDFIAVAEYLVKEKYTAPAKLGIIGGSNGGLLVGAVADQRPELYAVALPAVGVMDMLRYDSSAGGRAYSGVRFIIDPEQFRHLIKYSPLHSPDQGSAILHFGDDGGCDDRIVPSHSFKFTAALQRRRAALIRF